MKTNIQTLFKVIMVFLAISTAISLIISGVYVYKTYFESPDIEYTSHIYYADNEQLTFCPGNTIDITAEVKVNRAPLVVRVTESIERVDKYGTVVYDYNVTRFVETQKKTYEKAVTIKIPTSLPAGTYEYRRALTDDTTTFFVTPFQIPTSCFSK